MGRDGWVAQEVGAVVLIGEYAGASTVEEVDDESETVTGIDDDVQISERGAVNSGQGNEGPPTGLKMAAAAEVGEEEAAGWMQTKRKGEYSCCPVARTQEGVILKGMAGEDR